MKSYLTKRGYVLIKSAYDDETLAKIRKDLNVKPNVSTDFCEEIVEYPVFQEGTKKMYIPKFYAIKTLGQPDGNKLPPSEDINLEFQFKLRDNQMIPVNECLKAYKNVGGGILSLGCGQGKTIIALYLIAQLKKKALVIVHKEFLLNQWVERINQALPGTRIGRIQGKVYDVENKDIVIGMLQTLSMSKFSLDAFDSFGHIVIDEAHRIPSQVFSRALNKFNSQYMIGLSATPTRKDGLTKVLKWYIGDMMYSSKVANTTDVIVHRYIIKSDNPVYNNELTDYRGRPMMPRMINNITEFSKRTRIIINIIKETLDEHIDRQILILSDRKNHLNDIYQIATKEAICSVGYYVGGMKKEDLKASESRQLILGTYAMANEGLDIETLNCLILASPKSDVVQAVGRVLRKVHLEMKPKIVDIVDKFSMFENQAGKRLKFYKTKGYVITNINITDNGEITDTEEIEYSNTKPKSKPKKIETLEYSFSS